MPTSRVRIAVVWVLAVLVTVSLSGGAVTIALGRRSDSYKMRAVEYAEQEGYWADLALSFETRASELGNR